MSGLAKADELLRLMARATDDDLSDDGRYFHDSLKDLSSCHHGDVGEYNNSYDGPLVEFLWNNRRAFVTALQSIEKLEQDNARLREALQKVGARIKPLPDDTPADDKRDKRLAYALVVSALNTHEGEKG